MSKQRVDIVYNVTGQTLEFYPPEGVPDSAATYSVWEGTESNDNTAEFSGTASADSVSTTVDADSGFSQSNRRRVNLTATTNIVVGRDYWLTNAESQKELVRVAAISSGAYVDAEFDLAYDYASGATFEGHRQTLTVDSTFVQDESNLSSPDEPYRVLWSYSVNSVPYRAWTYFDLVRQDRQHGVTIHELRELWPDLPWEQFSGDRGLNWDRQIDAAFERVAFDLRAHGIHLSQVRDADMLDELVRSACMMIIAQSGVSPSGYDGAEFRDRMDALYHGDIDKARQKMLLDQGKEGAITRQPLRQLWLRR